VLVMVIVVYLRAARWVEKKGYCGLSLVFGLFVVAAGGVWPFLEFAVVYWRCPCAGRHLLSLPPQRK
jgi:hypothetical protein